MKKPSLKGILKSNTGIISEFNKLQEEDSPNALSIEISRQSFLVGTRLDNAKDTEKMIKLSAALTIYTQAQLLTSTDQREARKLYNLARRLGK